MVVGSCAHFLDVVSRSHTASIRKQMKRSHDRRSENQLGQLCRALSPKPVGPMLSRWKGKSDLMTLTSSTVSTKRPTKDFPAPSGCPEFRLMPLDLQKRYNLADKPEISGIQDNGDYITILDQVIFRFPGTRGRPLCEVNILVENIPTYVIDEIHRLADGIVLRHMIASCLINEDSN